MPQYTRQDPPHELRAPTPNGGMVRFDVLAIGYQTITISEPVIDSVDDLVEIANAVCRICRMYFGDVRILHRFPDGRLGELLHHDGRCCGFRLR